MANILPGHYVRIVHAPTGETEKVLGPYSSERQADRAEMGVLRNLSRHYYTETEEVK
ncbi:hypothetical protein SEA_HUBBS_101 [Microbacterium phage Hubbs]|nr:hypothetical protein SEA_HUBBS_101 [Microbacterium phage Hubbs]